MAFMPYGDAELANRIMIDPSGAGTVSTPHSAPSGGGGDGGLVITLK